MCRRGKVTGLNDEQSATAGKNLEDRLENFVHVMSQSSLRLFLLIHVGLWEAAQAELQAVTASCVQKEADVAQLQKELADVREAADGSLAALSDMHAQCDALQAAVRDAQCAKAAAAAARQAAEVSHARLPH